MAASRRCKCGSVATGTRVKGQWEPSPHCRRCLAMSRIGTVVEGLKNHEMRYIATELSALRRLEDEVRASVEITNYVLSGSTTDKLLTELDQIRELRGKGDGEGK